MPSRAPWPSLANYAASKRWAGELTTHGTAPRRPRCEATSHATPDVEDRDPKRRNTGSETSKIGIRSVGTRAPRRRRSRSEASEHGLRALGGEGPKRRNAGSEPSEVKVRSVGTWVPRPRRSCPEASDPGRETSEVRLGSLGSWATRLRTSPSLRSARRSRTSGAPIHASRCPPRRLRAASCSPRRWGWPRHPPRPRAAPLEHRTARSRRPVRHPEGTRAPRTATAAHFSCSIAQIGRPATAVRSASTSASCTTFSYLCMPIDAFAYQSPSPTTKTSRARKLCATRMMAPTAKAFPGAISATEKSFRSGASASRTAAAGSVDRGVEGHRCGTLDRRAPVSRFRCPAFRGLARCAFVRACPAGCH